MNTNLGQLTTYCVITPYEAVWLKYANLKKGPD
jgi:hypothetical protein